MATNPDARHDTHSTTAAGGWSTKRIAVTALFCAVAVICTLFIEFPILPGVTFLKYDPSAIPALIAGFAFGPATGAVVSILPNLVHLATQSGVYGTIMSIIATISLVLPAAIVYRRNTTVGGAIAGLVAGRGLHHLLHPRQHRGDAHLHGHPARCGHRDDRSCPAAVQPAQDRHQLRGHGACLQAHLHGPRELSAQPG